MIIRVYNHGACGIDRTEGHCHRRPGSADGVTEVNLSEQAQSETWFMSPYRLKILRLVSLWVIMSIGTHRRKV